MLKVTAFPSSDDEKPRLSNSELVAKTDAMKADLDRKTKAVSSVAPSSRGYLGIYPPGSETFASDDRTVALVCSERGAAYAAEFATGAKAERKRLCAILTSESAEGRPNFAWYLAFKTEMSADQAIAALNSSPLTKKEISPLARAMAMRGGSSAGADGSNVSGGREIDAVCGLCAPRRGT